MVLMPRTYMFIAEILSKKVAKHKKKRKALEFRNCQNSCNIHFLAAFEAEQSRYKPSSALYQLFHHKCT